MKVVCIGGGPGGLYTAILLKQAFPDAEIAVHERNRADDTFGWGVVFSDETLSHFREADPVSDAAIREQFVTWTDIETFVNGQLVTSTGHGFCGLSRKRLLAVFHERCRELGVALHFESELRSAAEAGPADLIVAADGINSAVREQHAAHFKPSLDWRSARFCWLGTTRPLSAFTFHFKRNEHGLFQVHAYPFERGLSTWIVECHEDTWLRAGLDRADEVATVDYCQRLFAPELDGHPLLVNRSLWRRFPTVRCATWHHDNVVLLGDAAHTAHFSIGSGTKLAMEDAIALVAAFRAHAARKSGARGRGTDTRGPFANSLVARAEVPAILAAYDDNRRVDTLKLQKAAQTSLEWFENSARYIDQDPLQFTFNLLTRSKRITRENLALRDPALVARVDRWFFERALAAARPTEEERSHPAWAEHPGWPPAEAAAAPPPDLAPLRLRGLLLRNRIVVSPMCQYSAVDGVPDDWHLVHLGSRAVGGAGLVMAEATDVTPDGRITLGCTGLWNDAQTDAWARITDFVHRHSGAAIGLQLAHAGRKGSCHLPWEGDQPLRDGRAWTTCAPSALPFAPDWPVPREMNRADMDRVREAFVSAARRAERAGFDLLELHMAHGYLLSSFLSPLSNRRTDDYGGSLERRMRWPLEVFAAVRAAWPEHKPLAVRLSASDWLDDEGGQTAADSVEIARALKAAGCDLVDCSSAGNVPESRPDYGRMYQVPFADRIRHEADIATMAVGAIQGSDHAATVLAAGRADLCALARPHLLDPYLTLRAVTERDVTAHPWPQQYLPARPRPQG